MRVVWDNVADEPTVIPRGPLAGFRFVAGGGQPGYLLGASEPDLQNILGQRIRPGDVVYDVGANVGFFTLLAAQLAAPSGYVYAFEPIEANARALRRNLDLNDVRHVEVVTNAVSNECASLTMSGEQATAHLAASGKGLVTVQSTTIDRFVARGHRPPNVIKIDVEGAEDRVLAGMGDTLRAHRPVIVCEIHYVGDDPRMNAITELLRGADYDQVELPLDGGSMPHLLAVPRETGSPALVGSRASDARRDSE